MNILFIPDFSRSNPYQRMLGEALKRQGVQVIWNHGIRRLPILRSIWRRKKPDILHIHWTHPFLLARNKRKSVFISAIFICELLILKLIKVKIVWTVHNIFSHEVNFRSIELLFTKLFLRFCSRLIVHCSFAKNSVINTYNIRKNIITIIPHGNYIDPYKNIISKIQARKLLQLNKEDVVFLCFGQIRSYKGISELIVAFKKLNPPNGKLLIAGKPYNYEIAHDILKKCEAYDKIKTIFEFIPDNELQIYLNAADVVALPYRDILTSGAVILAISFGRPIIASSIGCIPEVLDRKGSFLYNPEEKDGLVEAMKQALNANLKRMGEHNFELAKQLRWDDIAERTCDVYQKCLKKIR